jgi:pyruvate/2-oxoglutarate/acetoin dehydrogenase E1 component
VTAYKQAIITAMNDLARDPLVCFLGYGVRHGGRAGGTLKEVPECQLIETPVAENLMMGMAIGLALAGRRPVIYFERFDFILNAMDALVNHLDKISVLSQGEFSPSVIIRVNVGGTQKPLYTGVTHTQDFTKQLSEMVSFPVQKLKVAAEIRAAYAVAHQQLQLKPGYGRSSMMVELADLMKD